MHFNVKLFSCAFQIYNVIIIDEDRIQLSFMICSAYIESGIITGSESETLLLIFKIGNNFFHAYVVGFASINDSFTAKSVSCIWSSYYNK